MHMSDIHNNNIGQNTSITMTTKNETGSQLNIVIYGLNTKYYISPINATDIDI